MTRTSDEPLPRGRKVSKYIIAAAPDAQAPVVHMLKSHTSVPLLEVSASSTVGGEHCCDHTVSFFGASSCIWRVSGKLKEAIHATSCQCRRALQRIALFSLLCGHFEALAVAASREGRQRRCNRDDQSESGK